MFWLVSGSPILLSNYGIRVGYGDKPSLKLPSLNPVKKPIRISFLRFLALSGGLENFHIKGKVG